MIINPHKVTQDFESVLGDYTASPYVVAVDSCSSALFLSLKYENIANKKVSIPSRTYPSVPCEILHAGGKVSFEEMKDDFLCGAYQLKPTRVWDSALRFTRDMYIPNTLMCLSFTGPNKILKLGKGGAILTDDKKAYEWLTRARYSGRRPKSYHDDHFDMLGWNCYLLPELAARGLLLMRQFYDELGGKKRNDDVKMKYPDLSKFSIYTEDSD
mgnify:CR=1 FL=1